MCLAFRRSNPLPRLIAVEDIKIYKLAEKHFYPNELYSVFQKAPIQLNVVYVSDLDYPSVSGSWAINRDYDLLSNEDCMFVSVGLHAFTERPKDNLGISGHIVHLEGFIPKFSEYYVNEETGMIVASAMCYTEVILDNPPYNHFA